MTIETAGIFIILTALITVGVFYLLDKPKHKPHH